MIEVVSKCSNILTETKIMNNSVTGERHVAVMAYTPQAGLGNLAYLGVEDVQCRRCGFATHVLRVRMR